MVLLHGAASLREELRLEIAVAHLDHGLRPESGEDAAFVEAAANELGVNCHLRRADPPGAGENIEAWGRRSRYRFFNEIRAARGLDLIVTAHTADDVAETLLMRLVSNKELRTIRREDHGAHLLRPLLGVTRDEVVRYARGHGVVWREDLTNLDTTFLRNRVRHEVMPVLKVFDERIVEVLALRAEALAADDGYIEGEARKLLEAVTAPWGAREWLQGVREALDRAAPMVGWRIAESVAYSKLGFRIGRAHAERLVGFLLGNGAAIELPGNTSFVRRDGGLMVRQSNCAEQRPGGRG
jgi:tRNA(Ile)-lysidine synthase